ncbi:hypothetical protein FRC17_009732 [Serendipita sp. 399]|nr:hypothetical protein FRC17_009732 [Serendipita sp. 399]
MSQPRQNQTTPAAKSKQERKKTSKGKRNRRKNKGNGETLEGGKGKGKAIDTTMTANPATTSPLRAQSSKPFIISMTPGTSLHVAPSMHQPQRLPSAPMAQSSKPTSTNFTKTRAQNVKKQATTTDKGKGTSSSKANTTPPHQSILVSVAPQSQNLSSKRGDPVIRGKRDTLRDQKKQHAAVRPVIDPRLFSIAQKLPVDVLGIIILERSREKWMAPLAISQVCRLWRTAALATPAAWACIKIDPHNPPGPKFLDLWLSRCGVLTCRLSFPPWGTFPALEVSCSRAELLKGLSIFRSTKVLSGSFPNLEELRVSGYRPEPPRKWKGPSGSGSDIMIVDSKGSSLLQVSRFPSLRVLHLHSLSNVVMKAIARQGLPPLEELHIHATYPSWEDIVSQCAPSLVTLGINYDEENTDTARPRKLHSVTFPLLTYLSIVIDNVYDDGTVVDYPALTTFKTPSLRTYYEKHNFLSGLLRSPIHEDTLSVTTATFSGADRVDWTTLPSLTHMTIRAGDQHCRKLCDSLRDNPRQAPSISEIQWVIEDPTQVKAIRRSLEKRRQVTGKKVNLRVVPERTYQPPRKTYEKCFTYLPGTCDSDEGDVFGESELLNDEWDNEVDSSDGNNYYKYRDEYGFMYGSLDYFNPSGPYSGCPAGIDSDGPYDEFGRSWYD